MTTHAKTLDRLELTRKKFSRNLQPENPKPETNTWGLSKCPECGNITLKHEGGCVSCTYCSYSKCG